VERCRTPGYWATHACPCEGTNTGAPAPSQFCEKSGAINATQIVIDAAGGCIEVCGEQITNTCLDSADSAVEGMCIAVTGVSERQLARQLIAAALNCVISGGGPTCSGISIGPVFAICNLVCEGTSDAFTVQECIDQIDAFNNGLLSDCHERSICNPDVPGLEAICNDEPPNPAGSPNECKLAKKNDCTVIETNSTKSPDNEEDCASGVTDDEESCAEEGGVACAHGICTSDGPLNPACDPCVNAICSTPHCLSGSNAGALCTATSECPSSSCEADAFCCANQWDGVCVDEVGTFCGITCP
jgi:hypothetical protein